MKRSQAALEFLTHYGWALLTVIIILVVLVSFGVLDPDTYLPARCDMGTPKLYCQDFVINSTHVVILVDNTAGQEIYDLNVTITDI